MTSKLLLFFKLTIHMSVLSACLNSYLLLLNQHRSYGFFFFCWNFALEVVRGY